MRRFTKIQTKLHLFYLKPAGRVQWHRRGTVFFRDTVTGVAVRCLIVAEAASDHPALVEVRRAALAGVAAHAVFPASGFKDGLSGDEFPVLHVHKQPEGKPKPIIQHHQAIISND